MISEIQIGFWLLQFHLNKKFSFVVAIFSSYFVWLYSVIETSIKYVCAHNLNKTILFGRIYFSQSFYFFEWNNSIHLVKMLDIRKVITIFLLLYLDSINCKNETALFGQLVFAHVVWTFSVSNCIWIYCCCFESMIFFTFIDFSPRWSHSCRSVSTVITFTTLRNFFMTWWYLKINISRDPYGGRNYWPEGFGQLTNIGKMQHYELGKYFRKRYATLLGNSGYLRDIIYIQSKL